MDVAEAQEESSLLERGRRGEEWCEGQTDSPPPNLQLWRRQAPQWSTLEVGRRREKVEGKRFYFGQDHLREEGIQPPLVRKPTDPQILRLTPSSPPPKPNRLRHTPALRRPRLSQGGKSGCGEADPPPPLSAFIAPRFFFGREEERALSLHLRQGRGKREGLFPPPPACRRQG